MQYTFTAASRFGSASGMCDAFVHRPSLWINTRRLMQGCKTAQHAGIGGDGNRAMCMYAVLSAPLPQCAVPVSIHLLSYAITCHASHSPHPPPLPTNTHRRCACRHVLSGIAVGMGPHTRVLQPLSGARLCDEPTQTILLLLRQRGLHTVA